MQLQMMENSAHMNAGERPTFLDGQCQTSSSLVNDWELLYPEKSPNHLKVLSKEEEGFIVIDSLLTTTNSNYASTYTPESWNCGDYYYKDDDVDDDEKYVDDHDDDTSRFTLVSSSKLSFRNALLKNHALSGEIQKEVSSLEQIPEKAPRRQRSIMIKPKLVVAQPIRRRRHGANHKRSSSTGRGLHYSELRHPGINNQEHHE